MKDVTKNLSREELVLAQQLKDDQTAKEFQSLSPIEQLDVMQAQKETPAIHKNVAGAAALAKTTPSSLRSLQNPITRDFLLKKHPNVAVAMAKKHDIPLDA